MSVRRLHVSREILPFFEGWLEFAGREVPGVAECRAWPREFTIREGICGCWYCSAGKTVMFCVAADEWPASAFLGGEWVPFWTATDPTLLDFGHDRWVP